MQGKSQFSQQFSSKGELVVWLVQSICNEIQGIYTDSRRISKFIKILDKQRTVGSFSRFSKPWNANRGEIGNECSSDTEIILIG